MSVLPPTSSTLWSSGEWKRHLVAGAEQAFDTRVPQVSWGRSLNDTLAGLPLANARIALDNYEGASALGHFQLSSDLPVTLAVGPERGWSAQERFALKANQFTLVHLGSRVLRVETAAIAAISIIRAKRGQM
jgi:RsmE family RNA methyltransferase